MAYTLHTFLTTHDIIRSVPSGATVIERGPWAHNTKLWPTIMYFTIALASVVLNMIMLVAYWMSVKAANRASLVVTWFDILVIAGNLGVWAAAVAVYKGEKDKEGVSNDLWGWSCSDAAANIQGSFDGVLNFNNLCNFQVYFFPQSDLVPDH
jgi:hypothetical protein